MKIFRLFILLIIISSGVISCSKAPLDKERLEAQNMYPRLISSLSRSVDSLNMAQDSATVLSLTDKLSMDLTHIYYDYSADAALKLTEAENDSITDLTLRIITLKDSLLFRFAHPILETDSISTDSIPLTETTALSSKR